MYPPTVIKINIMTTVDMLVILLRKFWARRIVLKILTIEKSLKAITIKKCADDISNKVLFPAFNCKESRKMLIKLQISETKTRYYLPSFLAFVLIIDWI